MVQGVTYRNPKTRKYIAPSAVSDASQPTDPDDGEALEVFFEKMSKSKYNGVDPEPLWTATALTPRACSSFSRLHRKRIWNGMTPMWKGNSASCSASGGCVMALKPLVCSCNHR